VGIKNQPRESSPHGSRRSDAPLERWPTAAIPAPDPATRVQPHSAKTSSDVFSGRLEDEHYRSLPRATITPEFRPNLKGSPGQPSTFTLAEASTNEKDPRPFEERRDPSPWVDRDAFFRDLRQASQPLSDQPIEQPARGKRRAEGRLSKAVLHGNAYSSI
jgi:hypothetical protein